MRNNNILESNPSAIKRKNILYVNSSSIIYGAETRLIDIIEKIDRTKFCPLVLLPQSGPVSERLSNLGITVVYLRYCDPFSRNVFAKLWECIYLNVRFIRLLRNMNIDLVHVNLHYYIYRLWISFLVTRVPFIVHLRSHLWLSIFEKFVICRSFAIIFISNFVKRQFLFMRRSDPFMFFRLNKNNSGISHDGINTDHFSPKDTKGLIREEFNINSNDFFIGMIGAIDKIKGQDLLIKAVEIVVRKHSNVKVVIVGDLYTQKKISIDYRDKILAMVKDLRLSNNIFFSGFRSDIDIFMNEIDLLVQPSEHEALGTSMVEAMSCGKPVIGTDIDGIPDVIGDNEAGTLLNPRTPEAFAEAIVFYIENPDEARRKGALGRERVLKLFNIQENIKHLENLYQNALKGNEIE